jgi:hypothetical protein
MTKLMTTDYSGKEAKLDAPLVSTPRALRPHRSDHRRVRYHRQLAQTGEWAAWRPPSANLTRLAFGNYQVRRTSPVFRSTLRLARYALTALTTVVFALTSN